MTRNVALMTGGLVVAAAALVGGTWWLLGSGGATDDDAPETDSADLTDAPEVTHVPPTESLRDRHMYPYPFEEFLRDIEAVRKPGKQEVFLELTRREGEIAKTLLDERISITMTDTPQNIITELQKLYAATGVEILTGPPYLPDDVIVDLDVSDALIQEIVVEMGRQTQDRISYRITPLGFAIGTRNACVQSKLDALEWERQERREYSKGTRDDPLLEKTYRPDLRDAHIGAVARDIKQKTGVEAIIGPELWEKAVKLTWKNEPMRLENALDGLGERLRANWYVKDGRVFLLAR